MTNADLANIVAETITARPPVGDDRYHICFFNHKIQCLPVDHAILRHPVIFRLQKIHLTLGFTPEEWDEIVRKLLRIKFLEAKL